MMHGYELSADDPYHHANLAKLTADQLMKMRHPPLTPGASLDACRQADARARNLIAARRAAKGKQHAEK